MKISIANYKNIQELEFQIQEYKVNSLFGISGSGKTSIAEGLLSYKLDDNFSVGKDTHDIKINVNGENVNSDQYRFYNIDTQNDLIINSNLTNDVYSIFFGETKDLDEAKNKIQELVSSLDKYRKPIITYQNEIDKVRKEFIGVLNKNGSLPKSSKLYKLEEDIKKINSNDESIQLIKSQGSSVMEWKIKGTTINHNYENKKCPFCDEDLSDLSIEFIETIRKITPKNFDIIRESKLDFELIKVKKPMDYTNTKDLSEFKHQLIKANHISDDLTKLTNFLSSVGNPVFDPSKINEILISSETYFHFNGLKEIVTELNGKLNDVKIMMGNMKTTFNKMIGSNLRRINEYVKKLGIPYEFELDKFDSNNKTAAFKLYHIKDLSKKHRVGGLSFGEKNMLSLILFLLIPDDKMLLIDDPASSYDDFRRKTILDIIYEFSNNRTCLLLSHDHVFLKYSLFQKNNADMKKNKGQQLSKMEERYFNDTGKIMFFENLGDACIKEIEFEDFQTIDKHVSNHLSSISANSSFYRKILNLRLLAEVKKYDNTPENNIVYQFLSALLHRKEKDEIISLLLEKGLTLEETIRKVKEVLSVDLLDIPDDYRNIHDWSDFTLFEKAIFKREELLTNSIEKDELNNLVHFNDALLIQINPYKYNLFSSFIYDII